MKFRICAHCIHIGKFRRVCPVCKSHHILREVKRGWRKDK